MLCIVCIRSFCCPCLLLLLAHHGILLFSDAIKAHLTALSLNSVLLSSVRRGPADRKPISVCIWPILHELERQAEAICQAYVQSQGYLYG